LDAQINAPVGEFDPFALWPDGRLTGMFSCEPEPRRWFAKDRLPLARGIVLAAPGGSGKTMLQYCLAAGGVLGSLPWDWEIAATGSAALFLTEDTPQDVHRVVHRLGADLDDLKRTRLLDHLRVFPLAGKALRLLELNGNTLAESAAYGWLMERVSLLPKPVVYIGIDPALGVTEGDEMNPAHQRRLGELADRIAIDTGACVVLTAHAAKSIHQAEELGSHSARGSGALTDAVRGEFTLRTMTAEEARRFGIDDRAERQRYVQLAATKGNHLPPEAYVPTWLRRGDGGMLAGVTLEQVERGTVGDREMKALAIMQRHAPQGDLAMKFWRDECAAAGLLPAGVDAAEKAMQRIKNTLVSAGLVKEGARRGLWIPT
jgi:RecA-family ATPase